MSYIGHRCGCGHMDIQHAVLKNAKGTETAICQAVNGHSCGRRCTVLANEPPVVAPTFDSRGRSVERIITPGDGLPTMKPTVTVGRTCACDACTELYAIA